jgi:NADPH-dependent ferric siderophore reductase
MGFFDVDVSAVRPLTEHLVRITFAGPSLADFVDDGPDQRCKVFIPRPDGSRASVPRGADWYPRWQAMPDDERPTIRTYTVRAARPFACELDIDFVLHGDAGPASAWAARAAVGDPVVIFGAYAEFFPPLSTDWILLAGDDTALPAIAAILERVTLPVLAFVEVGDSAERLDLPVQWLCRSSGESLLSAVRALEFPSGTPYAWIAGESSAIRDIRRHLVREREIPAELVEFMGYWKRGSSIDPA